jgi:multiple sugar transport system substrate-binding protein
LAQFPLGPPSTFDEVLRLGRNAREHGKALIVAACPIDAVSLFFTLTANLGHPISENSDPFVDKRVAHEVLDRLHTLVALSHPKSTDWNPIQVYDYMVANSDVIYCPWAYGYSNYSRRENSVRLKFIDAPAAGALECAGTQLGGTGVAVSKASAHRREAVAYAKWLASPQHQRGGYFTEGGQPASLTAWTDPTINGMTEGFFAGTLETLRTAYIRPRFSGFVRFFEAAGIDVNRCLKGEVSDARLVDTLNERFAEHLALASNRG